MTYLTTTRKPYGLSSIFEDFFGDENFKRTIGSVVNDFPIDVRKTEKGIRVNAEIPGITKDDISIQYENGVLTIEAEKKEEVENTTDKSYFREIRRGNFQRSIRVQDVDLDKSDASYENGVLVLDLPFREEKKAKTLKIK